MAFLDGAFVRASIIRLNRLADLWRCLNSPSTFGNDCMKPMRQMADVSSLRDVICVVMIARIPSHDDGSSDSFPYAFVCSS